MSEPWVCGTHYRAFEELADAGRALPLRAGHLHHGLSNHRRVVELPPASTAAGSSHV